MDFNPEKLPRYGKHYDENSFWSKLGKSARKIGSKAVYWALVLFYTMKSPETPMKEKAIIIGALAYLILPVDLIPDFIPGGYTDDLAAIVAAVKVVWNCVTPEIKEQARAKAAEWFGEIDESLD